jgi:hypothetical protein
MPFRLQQRRDTAANWTSNNPTLAAGEIGLETDTSKFKVGTGSATWTSLAYGGIQGVQGTTGAGTQGATGTQGTNGTQGTQGLQGIQGLIGPPGTLTINNQTGTSYVPVTGDATSLITFNNASAISVTIPTNASVAYAIGSQLNFAWITGTGQPTISAVTPGTTTIISTGGTSASPKIRAINSIATAIKIDTDKWIVTGDIS